MHVVNSARIFFLWRFSKYHIAINRIKLKYVTYGKRLLTSMGAKIRLIHEIQCF